MTKNRIFTTSFTKIYPLYIQKAERKDRTREEVDQIIYWLTGYDEEGLKKQIEQDNDFETFFRQAAVNPSFRTTHLSGFCIQKMLTKRDADEKKTKNIFR